MDRTDLYKFSYQRLRNSCLRQQRNKSKPKAIYYVGHKLRPSPQQWTSLPSNRPVHIGLCTVWMTQLAVNWNFSRCSLAVGLTSWRSRCGDLRVRSKMRTHHLLSGHVGISHLSFDSESPGFFSPVFAAASPAEPALPLAPDFWSPDDFFDADGSTFVWKTHRKLNQTEKTKFSARETTFFSPKYFLSILYIAINKKNPQL